MTVIVATPTAMYSDSVCTTGESNFPTLKVYRHKGSLVGVAGDNTQIEKWLRWFMGDRKKPLEVGDEFEAVVLNKQGIWDYRGSMPDKVLRGYHGVGCGWPAAHAALLAGACPSRSIEIACQVTHLCGLPVQEFTL